MIWRCPLMSDRVAGEKGGTMREASRTMSDDERTTLDLADLRAANVSRKARWHGEDDDWTIADWSNAMCGEAGEAANIVKKIRRVETGLHGRQLYNTPDEATLHDKLAAECADVLCYLDLLAEKAGIDLAAAVIAKFNLVSEAQEFPERIGRVASHGVPDDREAAAQVTLTAFDAGVEWALAAVSGGTQQDLFRFKDGQVTQDSLPPDRPVQIGDAVGVRYPGADEEEQ